MKSNRNRLDQIEQQAIAPGRRCSVCVDWSATRVEWPEGNTNAPDPAPATCPECGYEPTVIRVVYEDRNQAA